MWVKFGHLAANSWRTVWVISSIPSSRYRKDGPKRTVINASKVSIDPTWRPWIKILSLYCQSLNLSFKNKPEISGRSETFFHNFVSYATVRHRRQIEARREKTLWNFCHPGKFSSFQFSPSRQISKCVKYEKMFKRTLSGSFSMV